MKNSEKDGRIRNNTTAKVVAKPRWRVYLLIVFCALLFVTGFFLTGKQHFSSMDYGMKNSKLRKQIEELESEKRRLILAREVSLSPIEIKKAARKAGLTETDRSSFGVARVEAATQAKATPEKSEISVPVVVKTASIKPVPNTVSSKEPSKSSSSDSSKGKEKSESRRIDR